MRTILAIFCCLSACLGASEASPMIESYLNHFETLAKEEKWSEILSQGAKALEAAEETNQKLEAAQICAQLASTTFYLGDYPLTLSYAKKCHKLSKTFEDPSLFLRALYLESAAHRALAAKEHGEHTQQSFYKRAVKIGEKAASIYSSHHLQNPHLKGKIYFNLGAAHADNPKGDLNKATYCYSLALDAFKSIHSTENVIRTSLRLGKVYLLQKSYALTELILAHVRPLISSERIAMHADYLEAQLLLELHDIERALAIAHTGLQRAQTLGAKEDEARLLALIQKTERQ